MLDKIKAKALWAKWWSDQYLTRKEMVIALSLVLILQNCL
jgi:hypothetical protein